MLIKTWPHALFKTARRVLPISADSNILRGVSAFLPVVNGVSRGQITLASLMLESIFYRIMKVDLPPP